MKLILKVMGASVLILSGFLMLWSSETTKCYAQGCPQPAVNGWQPYPAEIADAFLKAGTNRLGNNSPTLPQIWKGYPPAQAKQLSPYVPCILLQAMGQTESEGWYHFDASYGQYGNTKISFDCGYGIMQITSGMGGGMGFDPSRVVAGPAYNIGTSELLLIDKWNTYNNYIGDNNPFIVEDWYFAVWAYNSWGYSNNPNNPIFYTYRPPFDGTQPRSWYPYQELVWGYAANPPSYQGTPFWSAVQLTLPSRSLMTNPPPTHIERPMPSHASCSVNYLPLALKDYPACAKPIQNSDFENGIAPWSTGGSTRITFSQHYSGSASVWLGGINNANDTLYQTITIPTTGPSGKPVVNANLTYFWYISTEETTHPYDFLYVKIRNTLGIDLTTLEILNDGSLTNGWYYSNFNLNSYIGQTIQIFFNGTTDLSNATSFFIDDVYIYTCEGF